MNRHTRRVRPSLSPVALAGLALAGLAGSAFGAIIDGFEVTFNALPTTALPQGLPGSLSINGTDYTPANLVYPVPGGVESFSHQSSNP